MNPKRQNKTEKKSIFKPHDAFFKANMSKPEVIKDFLQSYLPIKISELVEYDSLLLVEPKSISPKLKLQEADLLYRIKIANQDSFLLFLMEHKSYTDIHTSIQILRYIVEVSLKMKSFLNTAKEQSPISVPFVKTLWTAIS